MFRLRALQITSAATTGACYMLPRAQISLICMSRPVIGMAAHPQGLAALCHRGSAIYR